MINIYATQNVDIRAKATENLNLKDISSSFSGRVSQFLRRVLNKKSNKALELQLPKCSNVPSVCKVIAFKLLES